MLQPVIEKLEAFEIALLKKNNTQKEDAMQTHLIQQIESFQSEFYGLKSQLIETMQTGNYALHNFFLLIEES